MPGSVRTTNYLQSVAKGYLVSAEFHERKALSAAAQGDDMSAAEDRHLACEYRKKAFELECAGRPALAKTSGDVAIEDPRRQHLSGLQMMGGVASFAAMILVFYVMLAMTVERGNTPNAVVVQAPAERTTVIGGF
jgi:hypothetical protein